MNENFPSVDRDAEFVPVREWMHICFELLDLLKAHKKGICQAAVNSFGYIAKSLGPQDMLSVLLTNLWVQERQSRVSLSPSSRKPAGLSHAFPPS
jgi:splicing factor 3B subunit 1